jgi:hypothetical protein
VAQTKWVYSKRRVVSKKTLFETIFTLVETLPGTTIPDQRPLVPDSSLRSSFTFKAPLFATLDLFVEHDISSVYAFNAALMRVHRTTEVSSS